MGVTWVLSAMHIADGNIRAQEREGLTMANIIFSDQVATYQFGARKGTIRLEGYTSLSNDIIVDMVMTLESRQAARVTFASFDINESVKAAMVHACIVLSGDAVTNFAESHFPVSVTPCETACDAVLGTFVSWLQKYGVSADTPLYDAVLCAAL